MSVSPSVGNSVSQLAVPPTVARRQVTSPSSHEAVKKVAGYGLPCAKCRTYYPADMKSCPVCKTAERVKAIAVVAKAVVSESEATPDLAVLEQERERFLREFKAQMANAEVPGPIGASSKCLREENHQNAPAPAVVCQECYDKLQERVDILEAALHIDLKEAAQIVYDAVWADPSDPSKTYENAAHALLTELRKRSGVILTFTNLRQTWQGALTNGD